MHRGDLWKVEVHDTEGDEDVLLGSSTLLLAGRDLPPANVLDMLLRAEGLQRTAEWATYPEQVWVAPVRPVAE